MNDGLKVTLKTARELAGLKQSEACKKLNVSEETLSNWERGKTFPDVPKIKAIEKLYGFSYNQIIFLPSDYGKTVI